MARRIKIGLISTTGINIGDEFIREGLHGVLEAVLNGSQIEYVTVNKHYPFQAYPWWHPINLSTVALPKRRFSAQRAISRGLHRLGGSVLDGCDFLVQCGTPVVWQGAWRCDWAEPLWHQIIGRLSRKGMRVLNLGVGSDYAWEADLFERAVTDARDREYVRRLLSYCRLTTVRDRVTRELFLELGSDCPQIVCPAILAGQRLVAPQEPERLVLINYMPKAGHHGFGQGIDEDEWRRTVTAVAGRLKGRFRLMFLCHDRNEYDLAERIDPGIPRFLPANMRDYFSVVARASAAMCNRLHASIALAGLGIPSVAVGVDTRLWMVRAAGLPAFYVKQTDAEHLEGLIHQMVEERPRWSERLLSLEAEARDRYAEMVRAGLS